MRNETKTVERDWHALDAGDVVWFGNGWFEVFDAYAVGRSVKVQLTVRPSDALPHIATRCVRATAGRALCQA
jgi:hypothetical protein